MTRTAALGLAAALSLTLLAGPALPAGAVGVTAGDKDQITAELTAGDQDSFSVSLTQGAVLSVAVKGAKKPAPVLTRLRLFLPSGGEVGLAEYAKNQGTTKPSFRKYVVGEGVAGDFRVVVEGVAESAGVYTAKFSVKPAKKWSASTARAPAAGSVRIPLGTGFGGTLKVTLKRQGGANPAAARLLDPTGAEVPGSSAAFVAGKKGLVAKAIQLGEGAGIYQLEVDGALSADSVFSVKAKAKYPKAAKRKVELPPEPVLLGATPSVLRQGEAAVAVAVTGENLLAGGEFALDRSGVEITVATIDDAQSADLTLDVASDAPFGARTLTFFPPPDLGEPVSLEGAIRVDAPAPSILGLTGSPVVQGNQDVPIEVTGSEFRLGGQLLVQGTGIVVREVQITSDSLIRARLDVDADAPAGDRDVIYRQPDAGGGATATLSGGLTVLYPAPVVDSVTPAALARGDEAVLEIAGANFRDGGEVGFIPGITLGDVTFVSESLVRVPVTVAGDAGIGLRDVRWTQPAEGGGQSAVLEDALSIFGEVSKTESGARWLGRAVAVSGDTIAAGAPMEYRDVKGSQKEVGAVYVYTRDGGALTREARLVPSDADSGEDHEFGRSVSLDGDTLAVGSVLATYVFARDAGEWTETARIGMVGKVVVEGDTLLVGDPFHDPGLAPGAGGVHVLMRDGDDWPEQEILTAPEPAENDHWGESVALDGDVLVFGGRIATADAAVQVYRRSAGVWEHEAEIQAQDVGKDDEFGDGVAVSGDTIVVGAPQGNFTDTGPGKAYVFTRGQSGWSEQATLEDQDGANIDFFGQTLGLEGDTLLVGANGSDAGETNGGMVYVYRRTGGGFTLDRTLLPDDLGEGDAFGYDIALRDGTAAIGAFLADVDGTDDGQLRVYPGIAPR